MKKTFLAAAALGISTSALAMPPQVPARYYEHRDFLVETWIAHVPCSAQVTWTCSLMSLTEA